MTGRIFWTWTWLAGMACPMSADGNTGSFDEARLKEIDTRIEAAVGRGEIPGAVFRLQRGDEIYEKAFGRRALRPEPEAMGADTIFDAASLTKVLATAPSVCLLAERGRLDLDARLVDVLPEFAPKPELRPLFVEKFDTSADTEANRARVTVRQLLTHISGLPPSISVKTEPWWGHGEGVRRCLTTPLIAEPGARFRYSDVNYILLGEIVERISGRSLDRFAAEEIFAPLGMADTGFLPRAEWLPRIAPTEDLGVEGVLRGTVHDPVARRMEGVAGHAGVFSTAADVARFAAVFLGAENRVFSRPLMAEMTRPQTGDGVGARRGLGWDIDSRLSYQRGEIFPVGGFGHTGWTGTSVWVDPGTETVVVLMANRNHPDESGRIKDLRVAVGTLAAEVVGRGRARESVAGRPPSDEGGYADEGSAGDPVEVRNGIDVLAADGFSVLKGLKVGLITNHTGIDRARRSTIDLLAEAGGVDLKAIFAPEHGIRGQLDTAEIGDEIDRKTGLPIYSLYQSKSRKPSASQLAGLDALVFDIQDIGCRFYTYISTMGQAMEAAAEQGLNFFVLDRVNPIGGDRVEGPVRVGESGFTAYHDIPVRHGMTAGELAKMFAAERALDLDLTVVPVAGWDRAMLFDATGLPWVNPSPNMRNLTQAMLYPGIGLLEFCRLSVGRGTDTPFEVIGAPYIDDMKLAAELNAAGLEGVRFVPVRFRPEASIFAGEACGGVHILLTDRARCRPLRVGLTIAATLFRLYPDDFDLREKFNTLLMHPETLDRVAAGEDSGRIAAMWEDELARFLERRSRYLLYP